MGSLSAIILYGYKFTKFSDSRWCTLGRACRQLLVAMLLGLENLVGSVLADKKVPHYYLNGWKRVNDTMRHFICVAAMCSKPCDSLLQALLDDDRLCIRFHELKQLLSGEMMQLAALPLYVWQIIADISPRPATESRMDAIHAAHVTIGFINTQVFSAAASAPWNLVIDGKDRIEEKLLALKAEAAPPPT